LQGIHQHLGSARLALLAILETPLETFCSRRRCGYIESFNGKLRDELLNGELFHTMKEAQILIEEWRRQYNHLRPHSSLSGRPPAPETLAWPGFSLAEYSPPALTRGPALALS
jgi:putative transposase